MVPQHHAIGVRMKRAAFAFAVVYDWLYARCGKLAADL